MDTCCFSGGSGAQALSGSSDGTVKIWDVKTAACMHTFRPPGSGELLDIGVHSVLPVPGQPEQVVVCGRSATAHVLTLDGKVRVGGLAAVRVLLCAKGRCSPSALVVCCVFCPPPREHGLSRHPRSMRYTSLTRKLWPWRDGRAYDGYRLCARITPTMLTAVSQRAHFRHRATGCTAWATTTSSTASLSRRAR